MKLNLPTIDPGRLGNTFEMWRSGLVSPLQKFFRDVKQGFDQGISFEDNLFGTLVTLPLVHGVEYQMDLPKIGRPKYFQPLDARLASGAVALGVQSWQLNQSPLDPQGRLLPNKIGLTAYFQPPFGQIELYKSANQTLTTGTTAQITWDVEDIKAGSLAHSNSTNTSRITCTLAGVVAVSYVVTFVAQASTGRTAYISKNNSTAGTKARWAQSRILSPSDGGTAVLTGSQDIDVVANDWIDIQALQTSGANLDIVGAASQECNVKARYVAPPVGYAAKVSGFFWGA